MLPEPPRPAAHEAVPAARLVPAAAARLAAGDWAGLPRRSCAEAGEVADPHRRYEARRALLELGLRKGSSRGHPAGRRRRPPWTCSRPTRASRCCSTTRASSSTSSEPSRPRTALFSAAQRLDPELPNVERNLAECARRKRAGVRVLPAGRRARARPAAPRRPHRRRRAPGRGPDPQPVHDRQGRGGDDRALPGGRARRRRRDHRRRHRIDRPHRRDRRAPRRPRPAPRVGRRLLRRAQRRPSTPPRATGSCTSTPTRCSWPTTPQRLRALTGRTWREAFFLTETNHTGDLEDGTAITHDAMRLFRNRPEYRFEGRIHEQIAQCLPAYLPERQERTTVRVEHFGYLGAVRDTKDKSNRNLELLERQVAEGVDNPFLHFNLGSEYAATGDVAARADALRARLDARCAQTGRVSSDGYAPALAARYVHALRNTGRLAEVATAGDEVAARSSPASPTSCSSRRSPPAPPATSSARRRCCAAAWRWATGPAATRRPSAAGPIARSWRWPTSCAAAAPLDEAEETLRGCLREHPGFLAAVDPYAAALLRRGVPAAEVVETVHALVADSTPSMRFLLAVALSEAGAVAEAEASCARCSRPSRPTPTRASRSPRRCWPRAASPTPRRVAAAVDPEAPCAAAAQRTELFARLTDGTPGRRRSRALALPDEERAVFAAWQAVRSGAAAPAALPAAGRRARPHHARRAGAPAGLRCLRGPRGRARGRRHARGASAARRWPSCTCATATPTRPPRSGSRSASATGIDAPRAARAGRGGHRPRASTRTPRSSPPRPKRWPRPDRAQVLVTPAESSDDKLGHGRPGQHFHGGTEDPMSFDVSPLAGSPYTAPSVDRTRRPSESSQGVVRERHRLERHAADPGRGLGSGRRRRAPGREPDTPTAARSASTSTSSTAAWSPRWSTTNGGLLRPLLLDGRRRRRAESHTSSARSTRWPAFRSAASPPGWTPSRSSRS